MATVTTQRGVASDVEAVPKPRQAGLPKPRGFACCRCRETIVQGVMAGSWDIWVTAIEGDPWCQGGAHLPRPVDC